MKKRKKNGGKAINPLARRIRLFAITGILLIILIFLFLFKVNNIIVTGNSRYTDEEIKSLVINEDSFNNSLLFCLVNKHIKIENVPLLDSIDVIYVNRNTIQLKANEKLTIGMFRAGDKVCCIDQDGVVVEMLDYANSGELGLPLIYNLCSEGTVGEKIKIEDESVLNTLHALMSSFEKYEIMPDSIYILDEPVMGGSEDETVKTYTLLFGSIQVLVGQDEYLEEKMRRLAAILPHLEGMSGTLHLETYDENTENIIFDTTEAVKPEEIPQAAEQSAEGAEQSAEAAEGAGA
jgi:cell division protein FtsQ